MRAGENNGDCNDIITSPRCVFASCGLLMDGGAVSLYMYISIGYWVTRRYR